MRALTDGGLAPYRLPHGSGASSSPGWGAVKIFLDEAGDLGFDFSKARTTKTFVVTLLVTPDDLPLRRAVARTLKHKVHKGRKTRAVKRVRELKGAHTSLAVKRYFWRHVQPAEFGLYTLALNKERVNDPLRRHPERLYNYVSRLLIEKCPLAEATNRVILTLDRSKAKAEQADFNQYLTGQLKAFLPPQIPLNIYHAPSEENASIQAVDLFCWGIFRKYERRDLEWYLVFREKIRFETLYLPPK